MLLLYVAVGGGMAPGTIRVLDLQLHHVANLPTAVLIAATGADHAGDGYAARQKVMARSAGMRFERLIPLGRACREGSCSPIRLCLGRVGEVGMPGSRLRPQLELTVAGSLRDLVPDDHILARVDQVLDLSWLRAEGRDCHAADGSGRPGIDPEAAVRLMLAGFLPGIVHDRRLTREAIIPAKAERAPEEGTIPVHRSRLDARNRVVRCPGGDPLRPHGKPDGDGFQHDRARIPDCRACRLRPVCFSPTMRRRAILLHEDRPALPWARRKHARWGAHERRLCRSHRWLTGSDGPAPEHLIAAPGGRPGASSATSPPARPSRTPTPAPPRAAPGRQASRAEVRQRHPRGAGRHRVVGRTLHQTRLLTRDLGAGWLTVGGEPAPEPS